jgi:hypothetical protein
LERGEHGTGEFAAVGAPHGDGDEHVERDVLDAECFPEDALGGDDRSEVLVR